MITRSVLIPQLRARLRFAAVARIAFPSRVYLIRPWTSTITTKLSPMMTNWTTVSSIDPSLTVAPWLMM